MPISNAKPALVASLIFSLTAAASACGKSEPCTGGGKSLDAKPVHAEWASRGGLPPGAVTCAMDGDSSDTYKLMELGANHDEGFDTLVKHFVVNSWKELDRANDETFRSAEFERDGHTLSFGCSKQVTDFGWCNVTFALKK